MKFRKTLVALGVGCTVGVGAALAASTPFPTSDSEANPSASRMNRQASMFTWDTSAPTHASVGSTSTSAGGSVGATVSGLNGESLSGDQLQLSGTTTDEGQTMALAARGIYTDFYTVSAAPLDQWDYYMISPVSSSEDYYVISPIAMSDDFYVLSPGSYSVITLFPGSLDTEEYSSSFDNSLPAM